MKRFYKHYQDSSLVIYTQISLHKKEVEAILSKMKELKNKLFCTEYIVLHVHYIHNIFLTKLSLYYSEEEWQSKANGTDLLELYDELEDDVLYQLKSWGRKALIQALITEHQGEKSAL